MLFLSHQSSPNQYVNSRFGLLKKFKRGHQNNRFLAGCKKLENPKGYKRQMKDSMTMNMMTFMTIIEKLSKISKKTQTVRFSRFPKIQTDSLGMLKTQNNWNLKQVSEAKINRKTISIRRRIPRNIRSLKGHITSKPIEEMTIAKEEVVTVIIVLRRNSIDKSDSL